MKIHIQTHSVISLSNFGNQRYHLVLVSCCRALCSQGVFLSFQPLRRMILLQYEQVLHNLSRVLTISGRYHHLLFRLVGFCQAQCIQKMASHLQVLHNLNRVLTISGRYHHLLFRFVGFCQAQRKQEKTSHLQVSHSHNLSLVLTTGRYHHLLFRLVRFCQAQRKQKVARFGLLRTVLFHHQLPLYRPGAVCVIRSKKVLILFTIYDIKTQQYIKFILLRCTFP